MPVDTSRGWDDLDTIIVPDYNGGFTWNDGSPTVFESTTDISWFEILISVPIIIDIGNDGNYTPQIIGYLKDFLRKYKPAVGTLSVGYFDSVTGVETVLFYITELPEDCYEIADPGQPA